MIHRQKHYSLELMTPSSDIGTPREHAGPCLDFLGNKGKEQIWVTLSACQDVFLSHRRQHDERRPRVDTKAKGFNTFPYVRPAGLLFLKTRQTASTPFRPSSRSVSKDSHLSNSLPSPCSVPL